MNRTSIIDEICKKYNINNYNINKDGSIDVESDIDISSKYLDKLPLNFNIILGNFKCNNNYLKSLKGSPVYVGGDYICDFNKLTSLKYSPKEIKGLFSCENNFIKSLEYGTKKVGESYFCGFNKLISLKGVQNIINGDFFCNNNMIISLKYGPEYIYGNYLCSNNKLKNLKGCAKYIKDSLFLINNTELYTFEGLTHCTVKEIYCSNTILYNIWKLFENINKIELFNDMDIIRENRAGKPVLILDRLNEFLSMIGKPKVEYVEGYIII